jgi:hypothetical protein
VGKGIYEGRTVMEMVFYGICIAIGGFVMGHVIGYGKGQDDMGKVYHELYKSKEY